MITFTARDIATACICLNVRKAARQVARRYDEAFRPLGITSGQFSILAALLRNDPATLGGLADVLGMDRTTLNRNLKPLEEMHLVATVASPDDRRVRGLVLTAKGKDLLEAALPLWEATQQDSARRLAATPWPVVRSHLEALS
jgi:DNA-binding MarR family transcriptional regulator